MDPTTLLRWAQLPPVLILAALTGALAHATRRRHSYAFAAGFGLLLVRIGAGHLEPLDGTGALLPLMGRLCAPAAAAALAYGALIYSNRSPGKKWLYLFLAASGWTVVATVAGLHPVAAVAPGEAAAAALCLLAVRAGGGTGERVLDAGLYLLAVRGLVHPLLYFFPPPTLAAILASWLIWATAAVGVVLALLSELKAEAAAIVAPAKGRLAVDPSSAIILEADRYAAGLLGLEPEDLAGRDLWSLAPQGEGELLRHRFLKALDQTGGELETQLARHGGAALAANLAVVETGGEPGLWEVLISTPTGEEQTLTGLAGAGSMAAGMAHDLKNVLQVILAASEGGLRTGADSPRTLEAIADAARKGGALTHRILDSAARPSPKQAADIAELVSGLVNCFTPSLPEGITVGFAPCEEKLLAPCDAGAVEQAVMNLLVNARDALAVGGHIKVEVTRAPGGQVLIAVEDDGPGIDPETADHIFTPLVSTKGEAGTGLGLAMVKATALDHGGRIEYKNAPEGGARFELTLPSPPGEPPPAILIIDADDTERARLGRELKLAGLEVHTTPSGDAALEILAGSEGRISTVVMDLVVEGLGGRNCLTEIAARFPQVEVVVHSSITSEAAREGSLKAGAGAFFTKPRPAAELITALRAGF